MSNLGLNFYPPTIYFNNINFNNDFYAIPNNNQGISLAYANTHFLFSTGVANSTATSTFFSGSLGVGAIATGLSGDMNALKYLLNGNNISNIFVSSNVLSNTSNILNTKIDTKQDLLTNSTNLLGVGSAITALDYLKITLNKPTYFPPDPSLYYNQTQVNNISNLNSNFTIQTSNINSNYTYISSNTLNENFNLCLLKSGGTMTGNLTIPSINATTSITSPSIIYGATELSTTLGNYLLKSGGTISGALTVNGTSTLYGNVGIGTTEAPSKLTILNQVSDRWTYDHSLAPLTITNQTTTGTTLNDTKEVLNLCRQGVGNVAYGARATFKICRYENSGVSSRTRLDLALAYDNYATDTNVITFLSSGNVGIGTNNPNSLLELYSTTQLQPRIILSGQQFYNNTGLTTGGIALLCGVNTLANRQLWLADSANLTQNSTNPVLRLMPNQGGITYPCIDAIATDGNTRLTMGIGGSITVLANGNVGIGNNNPQQALDVNGMIISSGYIFAGGTTSGLRINGNDYGNTIYQNAITINGNRAHIGFTLRDDNSFNFYSLSSLTGVGYTLIASMNTTNISLNVPLIANTFYTTTYQNIIMRTIVIAPYTLTGSPYGNTAWLIDITEYNSQLGFTYLFVNINCSGHFYWQGRIVSGSPSIFNNYADIGYNIQIAPYTANGRSYIQVSSPNATYNANIYVKILG